MKLSAAIRALLSLVLLLAALSVLRHEVDGLSWPALNEAVRRIPSDRIWAAGLLTLLNFAVLTCFDQLAFHHIGRRPRLVPVALTSFIAYAVSNAVGFALVSGAAVRYRFYSRWGLSSGQIARLVVFYSSTFWLGLLVLGGMALLVAPAPALGAMVAAPWLQIIGVALLTAAGVYAVLPLLKRRSLQVGPWQFSVPTPVQVAAQFALSIADWLLAAAVLWALLPDPRPSLLTMSGVFVAAQLAGLVSHVPAGAGIFESTMVLLMTPSMSAVTLVPVLLMYRVVYYLAPFSVALAVLAIDGSYQNRALLARVGGRLRHRPFWATARQVGAIKSWISPSGFAGATFLAGAVLLFSGATPAVASRLTWLARGVPIPLLEISHFFASVIGVTLLLLSRALARRSVAAWAFSSLALAAGIVTSLLKGADYEEAMMLTVILVALVAARRTFDRKAAVFDEPWSAPWFAAVVAVVAASVFLGTFSFKHVEYSSELWWQFEMQADASRFLRASVGAGIAVLVFGLRYLLNPGPPASPRPTEQELRDAARVADSFPCTYAHMALLADKSLIWNRSGSGYAMYAIQGRTWVMLHDPVAPAEEVNGLLRAFIDRVDDYDGVPVAYEIHPDYLQHYARLGLTHVKIGEEAVVPLPNFSLDGRARKGLRTSVHRLEREGLQFHILSGSEVEMRMKELRQVSDEWLARKAVAEKGFSLGFFDEEYLRRCPVAVLERDGRIEAFTNLLVGRPGGELSIDLARYRGSAPPTTMEGLYAHVMLWGRDRGYSRFNLGMAPLAGVASVHGPLVWGVLARYIYEHGAELYNFQGVRAFKEKFCPVWEPRYLAYPGGFALARALADVSALIAGGYRRIFFKAA
jgi:phosphatidylglycerol lysyltransferase